MNAALTKLIDAIFGALDMFRPWVVLYEYERGVMLRLGRFHRELGPGWHWRIPFKLEELRYVNVRKKTSSSWEMTLTTADDRTVSIAFDYIAEVADPRSVLLNVDKWTSTAYQACKITIAREVETRPADTVLDRDFSEIVGAAVQEKLEEYGIRLVEFGLTDRALTRAYRFFKGATG